MKAAIEHLNWLIDNGIEFPDAAYRTATLFKISQQELEQEYDRQCGAEV